MSKLSTIATFPANVFTLDNGLTVIHQEIPATPVVVVDVWVRAGATREPEPWSGMAHFLEHMIFKGTEKIAPGLFDWVIESRGGVANAATSHDYAHFFITSAAQYLEETLSPLADLLLHAAIPDDEFVRERSVVLEELRQSQDSPDWIEFQAMMETLYGNHPYGRSVLGTEATLMPRTPDEMRQFHRCHYQPENMAVVIVGGVSEKRSQDLVSQAFGSFYHREECPTTNGYHQPKLRGILHEELLLPNVEQPRITMAWSGPGVENIRHGYGLDLISVLLAEGRTSRLVQLLREDRQLVDCISSGFSLQRESSLFTINACLDIDNIEEVEHLICECLGNLAETPMSSAELDRCKRLLCNDYAFSTETPGQLAGLYGYYFTVAKPEISVSYPHQIKSLEAAELKEIAKTYLSPERYAMTVVKPLY
ncbi:MULTISPECIES: M16 family metallopeptidase [Limnospira]|uniref:M16 family metallopeptidase n=1 Tax=Limnospira TaxID=2596745 RepID=UPI0001D0E2EB|nr:pitrilysin family protein [Arthrospira platensis NCB002]MDT9181738.1 pitrilysin family protein [Limnospira sp. PMC 289.06]BAI88654.1 peptidase, M16 family [Arthrospira platensis NIES-39]BDT11053.1 peptidase, M16 family [Arthrospira platensis NIES-39]